MKRRLAKYLWNVACVSGLILTAAVLALPHSRLAMGWLWMHSREYPALSWFALKRVESLAIEPEQIAWKQHARIQKAFAEVSAAGLKLKALDRDTLNRSQLVVLAEFLNYTGNYAEAVEVLQRARQIETNTISGDISYSNTYVDKLIDHSHRLKAAYKDVAQDGDP